MATPERPHQRDREWDHALVSEHLDKLWAEAQAGFQTSGRGALFIDTLPRYADLAHPSPQTLYLAQSALEEWADEKFLPLVRDYDPLQEFVAVLSSLDEEVVYRVSVTD